MKLVWALLACALPSLLSHPARGDRDAGSRVGDADNFVRVAGDQFSLRGRPYRFVGANLAIMHGPEGRASADQVLAAAVDDGVKVGRIWAFGEGAEDAAPWIRTHFLFRAGPTGWIDAAPAHLDRVIASAGRLGMRLVITLSNHWADYGGVPRYLRWSGGWKEDTYGVADRFYSDAGARAAFRAHVDRLLSRTNHITGVPYRDDPTIMAWELMNESTVATNSGARARRAWIVEMARLVHARAPRQLVTPGVSGFRFERERQDWLAICRLPEVDFCDGHVYPEEMLRDRDIARLDDLLDDYVRLARTVVGKPFVLGEFGVRGDDGAGTWRGHDRAWWATRFFDRLRFDAAAGGLIWIYQGPRGLDRAHGITIGETAALPATVALRAAMRAAATALDDIDAGRSAPAINPRIADASTERSLWSLHQEFDGRWRSVPVVRARDTRDGTVAITWDPKTYARANWESSGVYAGGAVEHAWGAETGWFEYEYWVPSGAPEVTAPVGKARTLAVRARLSSEYPGTLSPTEGSSRFDVSLDGHRVGAAIAPRDDGRGQWTTLRRDALPSSAATGFLAPGRHRLRFTVRPGPRAHGLTLYGRPGEKPDAAIDTGPIELRMRVVY